MYQSHFASYIAEDLDGDSLEDKYKEVRLGSPLWIPPRTLLIRAATPTPCRSVDGVWSFRGRLGSIANPAICSLMCPLSR